jgi:hypothetical protein
MRLIMRFRGEEMWISWYSSRSHPGLVIFIDPSRVQHIPVKCGEQKKRDPDTHKRCAGQPKEMTTTSGRELLCNSDAEIL